MTVVSGEQELVLWLALREHAPRLAVSFQKAWALIDEVLALPPAEWAAAIRTPVCRSAIVLEVLLVRTELEQPAAPGRSVALAHLAGRLAPAVRCGSLDELTTLAEVRAASLEGNALRLLGRREEADVCLAAAGRSLALCRSQSREKGVWWCYLGLLRWEQGRLDEAEPLLRQAARYFGELGIPGLEAPARVLLGLLCLERGELRRAVRLLQSGRAALAATLYPWLDVRAGLGLATSLAGLGNKGLARDVFQETLPHYARVHDDREEVRMRWLEGRLATQLGRRDDASSLLSRALRLLLAEPCPADATLCFLDLAVVLVESKKGDEVPALLQEIEALLGEQLKAVRREVRGFTRAIRKASRKARNDVAASAGFTVRRLFRSHGHRVEALPFV